MKKIFKLAIIILTIMSLTGCFLADGYGYGAGRSSGGVCNAGSMNPAIRNNAYNSSACR